MDTRRRVAPLPAASSRRQVVVPRVGPLRAVIRRRPRLTWLQALLLVGSVTATVVGLGGVLVHLTDPDRFPDFGTGWWWGITTVTTVGYGDHVPVSVGGRLVGASLMLIGIACFAFLTAVAASAIVVGEVSAEEHHIQDEESTILALIREINDRLDRLETSLPASVPAGSGPGPRGEPEPAPDRDPRAIRGP